MEKNNNGTMEQQLGVQRFFYGYKVFRKKLNKDIFLDITLWKK